MKWWKAKAERLHTIHLCGLSIMLGLQQIQVTSYDFLEFVFKSIFDPRLVEPMDTEPKDN